MSLKNVKGGPELAAALQALPVRMERSIMRSALRQGANVMRDAARDAVPVDTGELRRSIRTRVDSKRGQVRATVVARAPHASLVEHGTKPHIIGPRGDGEAVAFDGHVVGVIHHPGAAPHPYMRPAADNNVPAVVRRVGEQIRAQLESRTGAAPDAGLDVEE